MTADDGEGFRWEALLRESTHQHSRALEEKERSLTGMIDCSALYDQQLVALNAALAVNEAELQV